MVGGIQLLFFSYVQKSYIELYIYKYLYTNTRIFKKMLHGMIMPKKTASSLGFQNIQMACNQLEDPGFILQKVLSVQTWKLKGGWIHSGLSTLKSWIPGWLNRPMATAMFTAILGFIPGAKGFFVSGPLRAFSSHYIPKDPCIWYMLIFMVNVGKYTIHGSYGYSSFLFFFEAAFG